MPIPGVKVAVCSTGLTTTAASVTNNIATLTMSSNPQTAGFIATKTLTVSGFTGGDTYYNVTAPIVSVTATTISVALTHANAAAGTNGKAFQTGDATTACAPLSSLFTDDTGSTAAANPTTSDSIGNVSVWATPAPYNVQYYGSNITLKVVEMSIGIPGSIAATLTTLTVTGTLTVSGTATIPDLNGGKYVDGTKYASLAAAFAACPSTGCVIDMRGNPSVLALGTFDPGASTPVALLLGPYAGYTAVQFTLRRGFRMEGASSGATTITSVGSNATPLFVIPQINNYAAQEMYIRGISFVGASGNTSQDGLFADSSTLTTNAGLWYSIFEDLQFSGFKGSGIHLKGNPNNSGTGHQFLQFRNCVVFGPSGRQNSLRIEGGIDQTDFYGGQYDGSGLGDGGTNIYIGTSGGGTQQPLTINFYGVTTQSASVGVNINGSNQVGFFGTHMEALLGGFNVTATSARSSGVTIEHGYFAGNVGVNAGSGYDLNVGTVNAGVAFKNNQVSGTPDKVIAGTNLGSIAIQDTTYTAAAPYPSTTSGVTEQQNPAASLDTAGVHTVVLNTSATAISTINSMLGVGESITFRSNVGTVTFASGGNLNLGSGGSPLTLQSGDTATFVKQDLTNEWMLTGWTGARSQFALTQGTAPATAAGLSVCYADSTANLLECSNNTGPFKPIAQTIASGTFTLGTGAINSNTCAATVTVAGANIATTDVVSWSFNSDPNAVTGYGAGATGTLSIWTFPTSGNANVRVCNLTAGSITPGAATLNWRVVR